MGNYAYIRLSNTAYPRTKAAVNEATPIFSAVYRLPILWLSLFDASDITLLEFRKGVDYSSYKPGNDTITAPIVRTKSAALLLMNERRSWLTTAFPELKTEWIDEFEKLLNDSDQLYVYLDSWEVSWLIATSEAWSVELRRMLGMFREPALVFRSSDEGLCLPFEEGMARIERSGWDNYVVRFGTHELGSQANIFGFIGSPENVSRNL